MATLIPAISTCAGRMTAGENRFARRLEAKLEDDYLLWYDVPVGPANLHPDFIVFNPRRGILVLEVKDWKLDTLQTMDRDNATLVTADGVKQVPNPLEQARHNAHAVADLLKRDPQLTFSSGREQGKLYFPWGYGVVLTNITRKQFDDTDLGEVIVPHRVICRDEMEEGVDAEAFQQRLWGMFPFSRSTALSLPQIDRIRWHLFPEIRINAPLQGKLFADPEVADIPDIVRVMDLQQEQLARSLGEGHRVIHGVAGSGKTLILGYRAEHLAQVCQKPILVLCYNRTLANRLAQSMAAKGLAGKVLVHTFHQWCRAQLVAYNAGLPEKGNEKDGDQSAYFAAMVERVIGGVDRGLIPGGQYDAVLIDEGHDFEPAWLKLVTQMVNPDTNSLLVLYDDAQDIYARGKKQKFSFKSVGIQAQGRTTILKINYRNTHEILQLAASFAKDLLQPASATANATGEGMADEDGVPRLAPISGGRHGPEPQVIRLPTIKDEAEHIADRLKAAHQTGIPWNDMAVIYHDYAKVGKAVMDVLAAKRIPYTFHKKATFAPDEYTVKVLTMHSCKGLEFPLVAIPGVGIMEQEDEKRDEYARLLYVAMTRATQELVVAG